MRFADKLIELINDDIASLSRDMSREGYDVCLCTLRMVKQYIKALQKDATNAEQFENCGTKHGRWLRTDAYPHRIYCSECFATFIRNDEFLRLEDIPHAYCPNCGAKMDGGKE